MCHVGEPSPNFEGKRIPLIRNGKKRPIQPSRKGVRQHLQVETKAEKRASAGMAFYTVGRSIAE